MQLSMRYSISSFSSVAMETDKSTAVGLIVKITNYDTCKVYTLQFQQHIVILICLIQRFIYVKQWPNMSIVQTYNYISHNLF